MQQGTVTPPPEVDPKHTERLGSLCVDFGYCTPAQVQVALKRQNQLRAAGLQLAHRLRRGLRLLGLVERLRLFGLGDGGAARRGPARLEAVALGAEHGPQPLEQRPHALPDRLAHRPAQGLRAGIGRVASRVGRAAPAVGHALAPHRAPLRLRVDIRRLNDRGSPGVLKPDRQARRLELAAIQPALDRRGGHAHWPQPLAIVGLGGTGAYVLDMTAKTHAEEIHLFDGDLFLQHNAFRAPGAASIQTLEEKLPKVEYFARIYSQMRRDIVSHPEYVTEENISALAGFDFVFICVDKPAVRKLLFAYLREQNIPFVDAGMELELIEEEQSVIGTCRVTMSTPEKSDHLGRHVSLQDAAGDDLYRSNIQIADLNALCAIMAVMRWKKFCGFYQDCYSEHQSAYVVNTHQLTRDELKNPPTE